MLGVAPRLLADTSLLGTWTRTAAAEVVLRSAPHVKADTLGRLAGHTMMRVLSAVGSWYRVRLPDGATGYLAARSLEPAHHAVETTQLALGKPMLSRPGELEPAMVIAEAVAADSVAVLGRFGDYLLVRTSADELFLVDDGEAGSPGPITPEPEPGPTPSGDDREAESQGPCAAQIVGARPGAGAWLLLVGLTVVLGLLRRGSRH